MPHLYGNAYGIVNGTKGVMTQWRIRARWSPQFPNCDSWGAPEPLQLLPVLNYGGKAMERKVYRRRLFFFGRF